MNEHQVDFSITLGECAHQIIAKHFQKIIAQEEAVFEDKDPEPLHQMRVGMRRLRTAVTVFNSVILIPKASSSSAIGKIARSLGETRDLDVLKQDLVTHYQPILQKAEQSKFDQGIKHLHEKRDRSFLNLKKTLDSNRYHRLKQAVQSWLEQPAYTPMGQLSVLQTLPDLLLPLICQLFSHPGWLVGTTIEAGQVTPISIDNSEGLNQQLQEFVDNLHSLRKQIKSVRYQAEFFVGFYGASYTQEIEEFKAIQDTLGQLQDREVLRQFLESSLNAKLTKVLPSVDQKMQQDQTAFWQSWQPLQQRYLSSEFRQSLRSLLTTPLEPTPLIPMPAPSRKKKGKKTSEPVD